MRNENSREIGERGLKVSRVSKKDKNAVSKQQISHTHLKKTSYMSERDMARMKGDTAAFEPNIASEYDMLFGSRYDMLIRGVWQTRHV